MAGTTSRPGGTDSPRSSPEIHAWRPPVAGVSEVFHARFTDHAYPMHAHATWTLLIVDDGMVRYDLDRHEHGAPRDLVTLLPPHVPHNGTAATARGFRKRVVYLDAGQLSERLIGMAVDRPELDDPVLRERVSLLHTALTLPGEELEAESRLALIRERLEQHLHRAVGPVPVPLDRGLAHRLRELLDARTLEGVPLGEAAGLLHAHPAHLVRVFSREFGMPPHQYLTTRRVDLARRLLLDGKPPPEVATAAGFYDQSHLNRHFKRVVGVSPGRYVRPGRPAPAPAGVAP
ncbi:AraC family transcriptional regulator [Streptomyces sp. GC420]|uniref:helix-turn-helix transcriptional regulator n=1 Tax=Streptomyces sp. GC420 TaxID=2697568 RepID=UPI001414EEBF|nr:AraC family transcriptional regulator [Streptomyces sp. GC420]NBM18407.1 helix-turn-helix domain-containing protein [Streptomyces sp. GC420]